MPIETKTFQRYLLFLNKDVE